MTRKITVIDGNTTIERDMTSDELAAYEAAVNDIEQDELNRQAKAAARQAVLDKLGLTANEAAALLG
jgi:ABC-type Na+ transport system ATPase subunit NatA